VSSQGNPDVMATLMAFAAAMGLRRRKTAKRS
jgi:uncharacterized protein (TIGR03382 family)